MSTEETELNGTKTIETEKKTSFNLNINDEKELNVTKINGMQIDDLINQSESSIIKESFICEEKYLNEIEMNETKKKNFEGGITKDGNELNERQINDVETNDLITTISETATFEELIIQEEKFKEIQMGKVETKELKENHLDETSTFKESIFNEEETLKENNIEKVEANETETLEYLIIDEEKELKENELDKTNGTKIFEESIFNNEKKLKENPIDEIETNGTALIIDENNEMKESETKSSGESFFIDDKHLSNIETKEVEKNDLVELNNSDILQTEEIKFEFEDDFKSDDDESLEQFNKIEMIPTDIYKLEGNNSKIISSQDVEIETNEVDTKIDIVESIPSKILSEFDLENHNGSFASEQPNTKNDSESIDPFAEDTNHISSHETETLNLTENHEISNEQPESELCLPLHDFVSQCKCCQNNSEDEIILDSDEKSYKVANFGSVESVAFKKVDVDIKESNDVDVVIKESNGSEIVIKESNDVDVVIKESNIVEVELKESKINVAENKESSNIVVEAKESYDILEIKKSGLNQVGECCIFKHPDENTERNELKINLDQNQQDLNSIEDNLKPLNISTKTPDHDTSVFPIRSDEIFLSESTEDFKQFPDEIIIGRTELTDSKRIEDFNLTENQTDSSVDLLNELSIDKFDLDLKQTEKVSKSFNLKDSENENEIENESSLNLDIITNLINVINLESSIPELNDFSNLKHQSPEEQICFDKDSEVNERDSIENRQSETTDQIETDFTDEVQVKYKQDVENLSEDEANKLLSELIQTDTRPVQINEDQEDEIVQISCEKNPPSYCDPEYPEPIDEIVISEELLSIQSFATKEKDAENDQTQNALNDDIENEQLNVGDDIFLEDTISIINYEVIELNNQTLMHLQESDTIPKGEINLLSDEDILKQKLAELEKQILELNSGNELKEIELSDIRTTIERERLDRGNVETDFQEKIDCFDRNVFNLNVCLDMSEGSCEEIEFELLKELSRSKLISLEKRQQELYWKNAIQIEKDLIEEASIKSETTIKTITKHRSNFQKTLRTLKVKI